MPHLRYVVILVLLGLIIVMGGRQITDHIKRSRLFAIKTVAVEPSGEFAAKDFMYLKGKNIFDVDPESVQARLGRQYPQIAYLKVSKRFPDTLVVTAKKRNPFAQVQVRHRRVVIDSDGVVVADAGAADDHLPFIKGVRVEQKTKIGAPLTAKNLYAALTIMKIFKESPVLAVYPIASVDVENLSKISLSVGNNFQVILDREHVKQKFKTLELMLSQSKIDLETVKYIDLRFKEPVVGKKR